jgi:ribosome recycling factor
VRPFDPGDLRLIEHAIATSDLGLTTQATKTVIRVPIPPLTQERRQELVVVARRFAEEARIAMRNVRRDALRALGALGLPDDERRRQEASVEALVKTHLAKAEEQLAARIIDISGELTRWKPEEPKGRRKPRE